MLLHNISIKLFSADAIILSMYCIVYRYLYSASHSVSQTEVLSVHFSSRTKVRPKARETRGKRSRENNRVCHDG